METDPFLGQVQTVATSATSASASRDHPIALPLSLTRCVRGSSGRRRPRVMSSCSGTPRSCTPIHLDFQTPELLMLAAR